MFKIKEIINDYLNRITGRDISHTYITINGDKIQCIESIDLYDGESIIVVAKSRVGFKNCITTINQEKIDYTIENFSDDIWNDLLGIGNMTNNSDEKNTDNSIYG